MEEKTTGGRRDGTGIEVTVKRVGGSWWRVLRANGIGRDDPRPAAHTGNRRSIMKTAYELAMERLNKSAPMTKITGQQKKELAELESRYKAKIAERELFVKGEIIKAEGKGDFEAIEQLEKQLASDRKSLQAELEEKKENVRKAGS